jgi:hypothetical protein
MVAPELLQATSMLSPIILTLIFSSLSYYLIASLLTISLPTSGLGLELLGRVHEAKLNWHAHVIRSLLETGFWISVICFTYVRGEEEVDNGLSLERLLTAVLWGTLSGVGVVLLGDQMENYLSECKSIRVKVLNMNRQLKPQCKSLDQDCDASNSSDTFASVGAFCLLYIFYFIGYHTLSFIFLFPSTLKSHDDNYTLNFFLMPILLATLAGVTFTATATILIRISSTENIGRLLLTRVTCAGANWKFHTKRSAFELGTWLFVVYGSFHLQYFGWDALSASTVEQSCPELGSELQDELLRAIWAVVWALQLGTIVGSALVLGNDYCYDEVPAKPAASRQEKPQDAAPMVSSTKSPCLVRAKARKEGLILYDGHWYSVGKFVPHHPGGAEVLDQYLGTDISFVFRVMHRNPHEIMKCRKPVRAATPDELNVLTQRRNEICKEMMNEFQTQAKLSPSDSKLIPERFDMESFEKDAIELWNDFVSKGYFKPSRIWIIRNTIVLYCLLASSIVCMKLLHPSCFVVPGILLGLFWHQSGYLMHDAEHHNVAGNELINDILGWMYGTVCLGVNGAWWREEHREHHAFLNTYDSQGFKDPQVSCSTIMFRPHTAVFT